MRDDSNRFLMEIKLVPRLTQKHMYQNKQINRKNITRVNMVNMGTEFYIQVARML